MISSAAAFRQKPDTLWFSHAKYGLFIHFLPSGQDFQKTVNAFDPVVFAEDCREAGVGYVIWTVGQNSGYFCTPNAAYDKFAGRTAGQTCSARDLPSDLAAALGSHGIKLLLYAPGDLPAEDTQAAKGMGAAEFIVNFNGKNWAFNDTLVSHWAEVLQEWSDRYGHRISGWWLDGCYRESGFTDTQAAVLNQALKHGNPNSIVAFNTGLNYDIVSDSEDFWAGESNEFFDGMCLSRLTSGVQWHELSYLGSGWGSGSPRCSGPQLIDYLNNSVTACGGVLTIDVPLSGSRIAPEHLDVLRQVKAAIKA
jgi:hypothetical protein